MTKERGIPSYAVSISETYLNSLRKDIWTEDPVKAKLEIKNRQFDIGFLFRGSHVRTFKKKSYHCIFRQVTSGLREIHLNAEYMDKSLLRNKLSLDFFISIGVLAPTSKHVLLSINGEPEGLYLQLESVDQYFLERRSLPGGAIYYAESDDANFSLYSPLDEDVKESFDSGYSRKEGTEEDDLRLSDFIYKINTLSRSSFAKEIHHYLNIDQYLRWLAGVVCTQNYDGFIHNYALYCPEDTKLFEVIPWDYDATWGKDIYGEKLKHDYIPIEGYNTLTARLLDVPTFRAQYKSILKDILSDQFTVASLRPRITKMHEQLMPHLIEDPYVKGFITNYDEEKNLIIKYITNRNQYLREHLSDLN